MNPAKNDHDHGGDPTSWAASYTPDISAELDSFRAGAEAIILAASDLQKTIENLCALHREFAAKDCGCRERLAERWRRMLFSDNRTMTVKRLGLAIALGLPLLLGHSQTDYAAVLQVHRATVSKWVTHWRSMLGLPPNQYTRPHAARAGNRNRNHRRSGSKIRGPGGRWKPERSNGKIQIV